MAIRVIGSRSTFFPSIIALVETGMFGWKAI